MTREEFDKLYLGKAVHCDTEEKANEFLALADSVGYKWISGNSLMEKNLWETHEEKTCYYTKNDGISFGNINYPRLDYQIIEYQSQPKFKVGDKVRVKDVYTSVNGKDGVIERVHLVNPMLYTVKINDDVSLGFWYFYENQLEKVEESTYEEETIDDIIEEIEYHQKAINVLCNRLKRKAKVK